MSERTEAPLEASIELIRLAQGGDDAALEQLIHRYLPRLQRWASGRLPGYARGIAETQDLVQDALIGTVRNLSDFNDRGEGALQAYLRQAVMNRVKDEIRRTVSKPPIDELSGSVQDVSATPLELAMGAETFARYDRALQQLDELEREGVVARIELGCSFQEVAELMGKPTADAARIAVSRAVAKLAKLMGTH